MFQFMFLSSRHKVDDPLEQYIQSGDRRAQFVQYYARAKQKTYWYYLSKQTDKQSQQYFDNTTSNDHALDNFFSAR